MSAVAVAVAIYSCSMATMSLLAYLSTRFGCGRLHVRYGKENRAQCDDGRSWVATSSPGECVVQKPFATALRWVCTASLVVLLVGHLGYYHFFLWLAARYLLHVPYDVVAQNTKAYLVGDNAGLATGVLYMLYQPLGGYAWLLVLGLFWGRLNRLFPAEQPVTSHTLNVD